MRCSTGLDLPEELFRTCDSLCWRKSPPALYLRVLLNPWTPPPPPLHPGLWQNNSLSCCCFFHILSFGPPCCFSALVEAPDDQLCFPRRPLLAGGSVHCQMHLVWCVEVSGPAAHRQSRRSVRCLNNTGDKQIGRRNTKVVKKQT